MALINCHECGKPISDTVVRCPQCGMAIARQESPDKANAAITTQDTSKQLKLHIIYSHAVLWAGVIWVILGAVGSPDPDRSNALPGLLILSGLTWHVVTQFRIWWHHK